MILSRRHAVMLAAFIGFELFSFACIDRPVSDYMRGLAVARPEVTALFQATTDYAKSKWYLWPSGLALMLMAAALRLKTLPHGLHMRLAVAGHKLFFFFASIAASGLITDTIKPLLGRARPVAMLREQAYGFYPFVFSPIKNSMPSGHATTAAALAVSLSILFPRGRPAWIALGVYFAISRVVVNAHYLSDIVAGAAVGALTTLVLSSWNDKNGIYPMLCGIFPFDESKRSR